uniref:Uncharacterized protein n=1 Tax=Salix viminalis TaxID=40686 RepID=A0A6N2KYD5_SALVM
MTFILYCYEKAKSSDNKHDHHIDKAKVEKEDEENRDIELVDPINQYMAHVTPKFEVVSVNDKCGYNDRDISHRYSGFSVDELES